MKAHEFCYWLQGLYELGKPVELNAEQTAMIKRHLDMVFIHDIDPKYPADQQSALNEAHGNAQQKPKNRHLTAGPDAGGFVMRC